MDYCMLMEAKIYLTRGQISSLYLSKEKLHIGEECYLFTRITQYI